MNRDPVFLVHRYCPEWFRLGFEPAAHATDVPRLIISFSEGPLRRAIGELPMYAPVERNRAQLASYGIATTFLLDLGKPWGFGGVFEPQPSTEAGMLRYSIAVPRVDKDLGACRRCDGKGEVEGMSCFRCIASGRATEKDWDAIDRVSATLDVLRILLDKPRAALVENPDMKRGQLVALNVHFGRGRAFIGAQLSETFGDYLRTLAPGDLPLVRAALKSAYLQMFPTHSTFGDHSYRASFRHNGQLLIDVPGDACGLYVDGFDVKPSGAMELSCHNVDGHHQQLALLCGLAALCGQAHKHLYPRAA